LRFIPESWGNEYKGDLLVAFHGSWNRTTPTGYKIVRIKLDKNGNSEGVEDFITGWLGGAQGASGAHGRPVDIIFDAAGVGYISDDKAGVVYRLEI
jgi:glucose/arabinose dehydrogenase